MSRAFTGKRKRGGSTYQHDTQRPETGAVILSGDAAQVDYADQVPLWKQEVTDERGRKRLHGAFTGGFSAGYFNTVGSAQGWTPSTFVSSRTARIKAEERKAVDYMDEEDMAEIIDDRELRMRNAEELQQQEEDHDTDRTQTLGSVNKPAQISLLEDAGKEQDSETPSTALTLVAKAQARKKLAKPLSLLNDDDDVDGYDIGPSIKYDSTLAKKPKLKKTLVGGAVQHTFKPRKTVRNPAPEPEVVQRGKSPDSNVRAKTPDRLLPSFGWTESTLPPTSAASTVPASKASVPRSSVAAPAQTSQIPDESHIPPWRRKSQSSRPADVPSITSDVARQALQSTFTPYTLDKAKHTRYRTYLESQASEDIEYVDDGKLDPDTFRAECLEFQKCALMYKPMSGPMSQKFTSGTSLVDGKQGAVHESVQSEALQAARAGKYGHLTRSIESWTPSKLLCKRFNVAFPDDDDAKDMARHASRGYEPKGTDIQKAALDALMKAA